MPSLAALESLAAASPVPAPATQSVHDEDGPSRRLADVSRKFSQFYSDLEIEKQRRSEQELGRRNALFDQVQRLEVDVLAETRRRREHEVAFRDAMVSDLRATETRLESKFDALSTELRQAMDILQKQFHEIREGLREERTQRRIDVEQLGELVVERVEAVEASIDDERVARLERETVVLKRVGEDVWKISEKVEVDVLAETRRRREHEVAFRDAMVSDLRATETRLESKFDALSTELRQAMDILQKQFHEIREGLREERTQRRIDVEQLGELVVERVEAVEASIDDERVARLERETVVLKRVGEDVWKISEKVDEESAHREKGLEMIQSDIARLQDKESTASDSFQNAVLSEIQNVKRALNEEQQERIGEDARIIDAVNDYTRVMQEGLRLVNRG